jgi:hypothetical protein
MANKDGGGINRISNGGSLPSGSGKIDIRIQGFTRGSYGAETFADRLEPSPPVEEDLL